MMFTAVYAAMTGDQESSVMTAGAPGNLNGPFPVIDTDPLPPPVFYVLRRARTPGIYVGPPAEEVTDSVKDIPGATVLTFNSQALAEAKFARALRAGEVFRVHIVHTRETLNIHSLGIPGLLPGAIPVDGNKYHLVLVGRDPGIFFKTNTSDNTLRIPHSITLKYTSYEEAVVKFKAALRAGLVERVIFEITEVPLGPADFL